MTDAATPATEVGLSALGAVTLPAGLAVSSIREYLRELPEQIGTLQQRDITSAADSATVVYLANESSSQPEFGMIVVIKVAPGVDAESMVDSIATSRWGTAEQHTITDQSGEPPPTASPTANLGGGEPVATPPGEVTGGVAYRVFSRTFPPGQFAIPNQPVYFLIWYRSNDEYAFMVIGHSVQAREELIRAVVEDFGSS